MSAHDAPLVIGPAEKVYRFPVRQICATTPCAHSVWTHDDPIFEKLRREQASANKPEVGLVLLYNKDARELVPFEGVFLQQCQANYRAVAPSSWISTAVKHNSGLLDKILCFCAADPAVPRSAARARVRKGTAYQGGYWLSCHRAPKLTKNGNFDYTDTCGMNVKLHFYKVMEKLEYPQLPKYCIYVDLPLSQIGRKPPRPKVPRVPAAWKSIRGVESTSSAATRIRKPTVSASTSAVAAVVRDDAVIDLTGTD